MKITQPKNAQKSIFSANSAQNSSNSPFFWLKLARSKNIGRVNFFHFLDLFGSAEEAIRQIPSYLQEIGSKKRISIASNAEIDEEIVKIEQFGAKILLFCDKSYPQLLREVPDAPPLLTIRGNEEILQRFSVAIVGSRNPSLSAQKFTQAIAQDLSNHEIVITSGMARGIDSAAHRPSVENGTIAVIAGGINHIYPRENFRLYEEIAEKGLIISENKFDAKPEKYHFVQRNRIISGLSTATVIIEAGLKSGSLTTAKFALEQGREVFAMPGSPLDYRSSGSNQLIKDGAKLITNSVDILEEVPSLKSLFLNNLTQDFVNLNSPSRCSSAEARSAQAGESGKLRDEILEILSFDPIFVDELVENLQQPASLINCALIELELAEKIEVKNGKIIKI